MGTCDSTALALSGLALKVPAALGSAVGSAFWLLFPEQRTLPGAPGLTTRNKKLLGAPGIAIRSKDANSSGNLTPSKPTL